jgi:hypothetical protein
VQAVWDHGLFADEYLESDVSRKLGVRGAIHLAHPARANCGVDPVMASVRPTRRSLSEWPLHGFSRPNRDGNLTLKPDRSNPTRKLPIRMVAGLAETLETKGILVAGARYVANLDTLCIPLGSVALQSENEKANLQGELLWENQHTSLVEPSADMPTSASRSSVQPVLRNGS